jgi:hypothetical protein
VIRLAVLPEVARPEQRRLVSRGMLLTRAFEASDGARDGNRTRTISLGI